MAKSGKSGGRRRGSRNKGFWFRAGRGWYVGTKPLTDPEGNHIKAPDAKQAAEAAYHRIMAGNGQEGNGKPQAEEQAYTVRDVTLRYLKDCKNPVTEAYCAEQTYKMRYALLWDLCEGKTPGGKKIHQGYGDLPVNQVIGLRAQEWLDAHTGWNGTRRAAVHAIRRAILYCRMLGMVKENPLAGFKAGPVGRRQAYFSEEVEAAIYQTASPALAEAIRAMIRTGARPGEVARLESRHVEETPDGQLWRFGPEEHKTGRKTKQDRVIPVPTDIAALVRSKKHSGRVFRNSHGKPWTLDNMKSAFLRLRAKLAEKGIVLAPDCTLYGARHTYAKRAIVKGVTVELLAARMGNTPSVCWSAYARDWDRQKDSAPALFKGLN